MPNRDQYRRIVMFLTTLVILFLLTAVFGYIWYCYYAGIIIQPFFRKGNWLVITVYGLLLYVFTRIYGGYRIGYLKRGDVIFSGFLSLAFVNTITYLQISLIGRQFMSPFPILRMTICDVLLIALWGISSDKLYKKLYPPHKMLFIYDGDKAESLVLKMGARPDKYEICEAVNISEGFEEISRRIKRYEAVIICDVKAEMRNRILKYCFERSIRTYLTPKISDTIVRGADSIHLFDTPLLLCRNHGLTLEQRFSKRALDLIFSVMALIILSPLMICVAAAIKLYDHGPVFYRQKRLTLDGKQFEVYKFRSMITDAEKEGGPRLASKNDGRITPVGKWIRQFRIDELPQFINIIKGDMSIVGPRPERPEIMAEYLESIPEFSYRLKVKAGLTGYAQILGRYNTTPYDKLKLDLMYIENYSFFLDIKLIMMTVKILFQTESTEGVAEKTPRPTVPSAVKENKEKLEIAKAGRGGIG